MIPEPMMFSESALIGKGKRDPVLPAPPSNVWVGEAGVNIPVSVAPLIRVFRPLVFRQVFPWRQVFQ